jgi:CO/xanthine dehydrogenase Mo-binding subunit
MKTIGHSIARVDGVAKVTGQAIYVDDLRPDGCLYGATVRSQYAHAEITAIRRDPDYDWRDIELVTAKDIPGENTVLLFTKDQPVLADGIVRHVTEPIALIAAPTRERALEAVNHIQVDYRPLSALFDPFVSENSELMIYPPNNIFKEITMQRGNPDQITAGYVIEGEYKLSHQEQLYIEPQGVLAIPQRDGSLTIMGSMQCPYFVVKALKPILNTDNFNVIQTVTGGGFGGKEEYPSMIAAHVALLAHKTGRPVKLIYRRDEDLLATPKRHPAFIRLRTRVDDSGLLLSLEADLLMDGGAYNTLSPVVLSRAVLHVSGPYRWDHVRVVGKMVATNTPPNGAFRGFGAPQAQFAMERHLDRISRELKLDPIALRRRNFLQEGDETATGQKLDKSGADAVINAALAAACEPLPPMPSRPGVDPRFTRFAEGRGLATVFHGCGFTGNGEAGIKGRVAIELEGDRVIIYTSSIDMGQGADTTLSQIVAETLDIDISRVVMAEHDTAKVPDSGPTVASRTAMVVGKICQEAALKLQITLANQYQLNSQLPFDEILKAHTSGSNVRVEHQYESPQMMIWDPDTHQGDAYPTYGWNCTLVDLAVDLDSGEVIYRRAITATDVGKALNPVVVSGQIEGGLLQALGWANCEEVVRDDRGCMLNHRFTNYIIPTALDSPPMRTEIIEIPYPGGPFGAKGIGEIPMDAPGAAVAQAVENAIGAVFNQIPITPEMILDAILRSDEQSYNYCESPQSICPHTLHNQR